MDDNSNLAAYQRPTKQEQFVGLAHALTDRLIEYQANTVASCRVQRSTADLTWQGVAREACAMAKLILEEAEKI